MGKFNTRHFFQIRDRTVVVIAIKRTHISVGPAPIYKEKRKAMRPDFLIVGESRSVPPLAL